MRSDLGLYIILCVPILIVLVFRYIPMVGILMAFQNYNIMDGFFASRWVGLKWFERFITSGNFFQLMRNTLLLNFFSLLFGFPAPIILALLLNEVQHKAFKRVTQTISYLPHFLSTVVVVGMLFQLLSPSSGVINRLIVALGGEPIFFMGQPRWFRPIYVVSGIWQSIGWSSIIYLAALTAISSELYEAAIVDGANRWRQTIHITLPGILPTIVVLFIMKIGDIMDVGFEKILLMYSPLTYETADVIDTFVYRRGLGNMDYSYATAVGFLKSVIGFVMIVTANKIARRVGETSLW